MKRMGWFSIILGTLLFFIGSSFAISLNFTGAWEPNAWRFVTDQSSVTQLFVFFLFNADFWGVMMSIVGLFLVFLGFLVLRENSLALKSLRPTAWIFLILSLVFGIGLIYFSRHLLLDNPFSFMTPSINKGTTSLLWFLGLVVLLFSGVPWGLFLYYLRRDK